MIVIIIKVIIKTKDINYRASYTSQPISVDVLSCVLSTHVYIEFLKVIFDAKIIDCFWWQ